MQINEYGKPDSPLVLIQPVDDHDLAWIEIEAGWIKEYAGMDFRLITVKTDDWFSDLTPWRAPAVFGGMEFGDGAEKTLEEILKLTGEHGKKYILGGYSMGGLFALWAATRTDRFQAIAAASPSVWIHGWIPFAKKNRPMAEAVYLSLGDREEHVKNQAIARVGDNLRAYYELLRTPLDPEHCTLVWEEGGHFNDNAGRLARAFAYSVSCLSFSM